MSMANYIAMAQRPGGSSASAETVLLMGFEGADASTSFVDESAYARTITVLGDAQIDTAQFKYGTASGLFDGTGDGATTPNASEFTLGTKDFTIESFVRFNNTSTSQAIVAQWNGSGAGLVWMLNKEGTALRFLCRISGSNVIVSGSWSPAINTWYHVAATRQGSAFKVYLDGTQVGSTITNAGSIAAADNLMTIGFTNTGSPANRLNGWLDELRIIVGTAAYTANFTPPAAPFSRS